MTDQDLKNMVTEFEETIKKVLQAAYVATGYEWMVVPRTGAYRSIKEQHALYIQPKDGKDNDGDGKIDEADEFVTAADGGQSPHNYNLARDLVPLSRPGQIWWTAPKMLWETMGQIAEKNGLVWGGRWKRPYDAPHVEHAGWKAVRAAWKAGEIKVV